MTNLPTNRTVTITRQGAAHLSDLPALILPARLEVVALREVPAGKAFEIFFTDLVEVHETDRITNADDPTETYRVVGVAHYDTPHGAHTEVIAEARLGNA
jgi:hypothetical protein